MLTQDQKKQILGLVQAGVQKQKIAHDMKISNGTVTGLLNTRKRVMVISDLHCGHVSGLTPTKWHTQYSDFYPQQVEMWEWYKRKCHELNPDVLFVVGDMVDGKGKRSGGTEQISCSFKEQLKMAQCCLDVTGAREIVAVYGTPYHVGNEEDYEAFLKNLSGIEGHLFAEEETSGLVFDIKHKVGKSSSPYGNFTPLAKSRFWNLCWSERKGQPKADVIIRGHVHKYDFCGDDYYLTIACPALSGWGSKYGERQCEGIVNTGLLWFDLYDGTDLSNLQWRAEIPSFVTQKVKVYSV